MSDDLAAREDRCQSSTSLSWQLSLGFGAAALFVIIAAWAGAGAGVENSWKVDNDLWLASASFRSDCLRMQVSAKPLGDGLRSLTGHCRRHAIALNRHVPMR